MQNPFESGHIKNYVLLYASVVVIMVLFFIASTLFNDIEFYDKKEFNTQKEENSVPVKEENLSKSPKLKFKLLDKAY